MKKFIAFLCIAGICCSLCGCSLFTVTTDELLSPPAPEGDLFPISNALEESAEKGYVLKYPTEGTNRSAIVTEDVDGDGQKEAFAFYGVSSGEEAAMHLNVLKKQKDKWKSVADIKVTASGVDRIDFYDLNGSGEKKILVGWQIYGSNEKKLGVYAFSGGDTKELFSTKYTAYGCYDLTGNGKRDIFLQYLNTTELSNRAYVYSVRNDEIVQTAGCLLDRAVKSVSSMQFGKLKNGERAVYIDEIKGLGSVSEVLCLENGELKNPLLDQNSFENAATLRYSNLKCTDINGDRILEVPTAVQLPGIDSGEEKFYYTNWCSFDGKALAIEQSAYINTTDSYSIKIPAKLAGKLALKKDAESKSRTFYHYDAETKSVGTRLFTVTVYTAEEYKNAKKKDENLFEIYKTDSAVYGGTINMTMGEYGISKAELTEMFALTE